MLRTPGYRIRLTILSAIIAVLLYALLFYQPPRGGLWMQVFLNSLHVPVFGLIAVSVFFLLHPERSWVQRALIALGASCALGLLSEIAQTVTSRDASVTDFIADCMGATGFLALALATLPGARLSPARRIVAALGGTVLLAWALAPLAVVTAAYAERNRLFPVIFAADSVFGRKLLRLQHVEYDTVLPPAANEPHARIILLEAPWPGVALHDVQPDWSAYSALLVEISIEGNGPLSLGLRIHDKAHEGNQLFSDRFNRTFELEPGRHTLEIPLSDLVVAPKNREMDLTAVSELIIFGSESDAGRTFRLYDIRLE